MQGEWRRSHPARGCTPGAKAPSILKDLRGAEAPLFHGCAGVRGAYPRSRGSTVIHEDPAAFAPPGIRLFGELLEDKLEGCLHQPRRGGADDLAECGSIVDVAVYRSWAEELRVIENVERLQAEFQLLRFRQRHGLHQGHIVVIESGTVEEAAPGVSRRAQRLQSEKRRIEIRLPVARIGIQIERSGRVLRFVNSVVIDAVWLRAEQGVVAVVEQRHREAAAEMSDPGNRPAAGPAIGAE